MTKEEAMEVVACVLRASLALRATFDFVSPVLAAGAMRLPRLPTAGPIRETNKSRKRTRGSSSFKKCVSSSSRDEQFQQHMWFSWSHRGPGKKKKKKTSAVTYNQADPPFLARQQLPVE